MKALAKAIPDTNSLLVSVIRANLPAVLKEHIGGTFADWDSFTDAVCKVSLADIADSCKGHPQTEEITQARRGDPKYING